LLWVPLPGWALRVLPDGLMLLLPDWRLRPQQLPVYQPPAWTLMGRVRQLGQGLPQQQVAGMGSRLVWSWRLAQLRQQVEVMGLLPGLR
jgi:hypothetical protein